MAETLALYRRLVGAQVRSQLQYRLSFGLDTVGSFVIAFLDFLAVLIIFSNVPVARRLERRGDRVPVRGLDDLVRRGRHGRRSPRPVPPDDPGRVVRRDPDPSAWDAAPGGRSDFSLRKVGRLAQGLRRARVCAARARHRLGSGEGRDDRHDARRRGGDLRRGLGRRLDDRLLDRRRRRVHERLHIRRNVSRAVPDLDLRRVVPAVSRVSRPDRVRLLLPVARTSSTSRTRSVCRV